MKKVVFAFCIFIVLTGCFSSYNQKPLDYEKLALPSSYDELREECKVYVMELDALLVPYSPENDVAIAKLILADGMKEAFQTYADSDYTSIILETPLGAKSAIKFNYYTHNHFLRWVYDDESGYSNIMDISFNTEDGSYAVSFRTGDSEIEDDNGEYRQIK